MRSPPNFSLLTDLYQLTMSYAYWKSGRDSIRSIFYMQSRENPFRSGYTLFCGLGPFLETLKSHAFGEDELAYLRTLKDFEGNPLFTEDFLEYLGDFRFRFDVHAVPEGSCVFPGEPLVRVEGGLMECQMVETLLLNQINFPTLVATKAARICTIAGNVPVLEFGMRRAHGADGAVTASRAAYVGGCSATSNLAAGRLYGVPVRGTHSHSWVTSYEDELEAFRAYGKIYPANCVFLLDTYDTIEGLKKALEAAGELPDPKKNLLGVRIDSGDLAFLSKQARRMLDKAGFEKTRIIAGNSLDETLVDSIKNQGARVNLWVAGTKLVTCEGQSFLNGVYKMSALRKENGEWLPKIKISEDPSKVSLPGKLQIRRFFKNGKALGDIVFDELAPPSSKTWKGFNLLNPIQSFQPVDYDRCEDLLRPVVKNGIAVAPLPGLESVREEAGRALGTLDETIKRLVNPHRFPSGVEESLFHRVERMIVERKR